MFVPDEGSSLGSFGRGGGGGTGFFIDGVEVNSRMALNFINHGLGIVEGGAGVYGNESLIVMDQFGPGIDGGYDFIGQQAFFAPSMFGGEQQGQDGTERTPGALKDSIYGGKKLMKKINDCLRKLLGKNFSKF